MPSCSKNDVILVRYPFSDLSGAKVRPAVVVSAPSPSRDLFVVPLTSRTGGLLPGEFPLADWAAAGLNVLTTAKRGLYTIHDSLVLKVVGTLTPQDTERLERSLREWLGFTAP